MARCFLCGKKRQVGRSSRHKRGVAGKQWLKRAQKTIKIFKPNLHTTRLVKDNKKIKAKVCTKCLRLVKKKGETIHGWKAATVVTKKVEEEPVEKKAKDKPFIVKKKPAPEKSPAQKVE
jgi:ribosomal protein L28